MTRTLHRLRTHVLMRRFRRIASAGHPRDHHQGPAPIRVEHVDDPDRPFRLIRAAGVLSATTFDRLLEAWANISEPYAVHLDLGDARIADLETMRRLETALDHLEGRRIEIRLVGLDPNHPVRLA